MATASKAEQLVVGGLLAAADGTGLSGRLLRVAPDNLAAIRLYRATGFTEVEAERAAEGNSGQPTAYRWFEWHVAT